jgi:hypothetical protein
MLEVFHGPRLCGTLALCYYNTKFDLSNKIIVILIYSFFPSMFQNHVMREDHLVTNPYIRDMFIGNHINFDVNLCTEVIGPAFI